MNASRSLSTASTDSSASRAANPSAIRRRTLFARPFGATEKACLETQETGRHGTRRPVSLKQLAGVTLEMTPARGLAVTVFAV